jgi:hypothetical protein
MQFNLIDFLQRDRINRSKPGQKTYTGVLVKRTTLVVVSHLLGLLSPTETPTTAKNLKKCIY